MSNHEPAFVRCVIVEERDRSLRITQEAPRGGTVEAWIPRSQVLHISKKPKLENGTWPADIEMPEWLAEEKGLDYK